MKIIETQTKEDSLYNVQVIDAFAAQYWVSEGHVVTPDVNSPTGFSVVGKNKKTKQNELHATKTLTWDEPTESPDGTYYILSLSNKEQFKNWKTVFAQNNLTLRGQEKEMPKEWRKAGEL